MSDNHVSELTTINYSLSVLGNCIAALGNDQRSHVPYRNSKLTRYLKDSIGGNAITTFLITISPSTMAYHESLSSLRFAERARKVPVRAVKNVGITRSLEEAEKEIARLEGLLNTVTSSNQSMGNSQLFVEKMTRLDQDNLTLREKLVTMGERLDIEREQRLYLHSLLEKSSQKSGLLMSEPYQFEERLNQLETIEYETRARMADADNFLTYLKSLPIKFDTTDEETTVDIMTRVQILEKTLEHQSSEFVRAKKMFLNDIERLREVIRVKNQLIDELQQSNTRLGDSHSTQLSESGGLLNVSAVKQNLGFRERLVSEIMEEISFDPSLSVKKFDKKVLESSIRALISGDLSMIVESFNNSSHDDVSVVIYAINSWSRSKR
ncbi:hypothetical protein GEMRC1_010683 [Eukaryota sp. GEM-RC1]